MTRTFGSYDMAEHALNDAELCIAGIGSQIARKVEEIEQLKVLGAAKYKVVLEAREALGRAPETTGDYRLGVIHDFWYSNADGCEGLWALSDGYGMPGFVPPQGYDWSGIRDSSDGAVQSMYLHVLACTRG